ncbi:uncharacterized protein LOC113146458 [Cyclospora cayetanensis]|uniref:Uncharacterized protein LOC113146458 n=1 Tax=Cyclospora cayetanensis TaxID=88456 RepID=A0A6P6RRB3_9EIME|nr:uncharacterized protein LOC113146458 [Cyclospora cayetanensis]
MLDSTKSQALEELQPSARLHPYRSSEQQPTKPQHFTSLPASLAAAAATAGAAAGAQSIAASSASRTAVAAASAAQSEERKLLSLGECAAKADSAFSSATGEEAAAQRAASDITPPSLRELVELTAHAATSQGSSCNGSSSSWFRPENLRLSERGNRYFFLREPPDAVAGAARCLATLLLCHSGDLFDIYHSAAQKAAPPQLPQQLLASPDIAVKRELEKRGRAAQQPAPYQLQAHSWLEDARITRQETQKRQDLLSGGFVGMHAARAKWLLLRGRGCCMRLQLLQSLQLLQQTKAAVLQLLASRCHLCEHTCDSSRRRNSSRDGALLLPEAPPRQKKMALWLLHRLLHATVGSTCSSDGRREDRSSHCASGGAFLEEADERFAHFVVRCLGSQWKQTLLQHMQNDSSSSAGEREFPFSGVKRHSETDLQHPRKRLAIERLLRVSTPAAGVEPSSSEAAAAAAAGRELGSGGVACVAVQSIGRAVVVRRVSQSCCSVLRFFPKTAVEERRLDAAAASSAAAASAAAADALPPPPARRGGRKGRGGRGVFGQQQQQQQLLLLCGFKEQLCPGLLLQVDGMLPSPLQQQLLRIRQESLDAARLREVTDADAAAVAAFSGKSHCEEHTARRRSSVLSLGWFWPLGSACLHRSGSLPGCPSWSMRARCTYTPRPSVTLHRSWLKFGERYLRLLRDARSISCDHNVEAGKNFSPFCTTRNRAAPLHGLLAWI